MTVPAFPASIRVVDSHTEGEPTRVVIEGWRQPEGATMAARRDDLAARWDHLRSAVICEPRGHDAVVGALLTPPVTPGATAGVIFFNNVGYLGMCGHGTIGVIRTLAHLGRIGVGEVRLDTPVGTVTAELERDGMVTIRNVASYCLKTDVTVEVPGLGRVTGDIAYGGNWFFITHLAEVSLALDNVEALTRITGTIMRALHDQRITGDGGAEIDHVELSGPPTRPDADSRNFVLCPGGAYDRSPCGTGTSARMAALFERGQLALGAPWRQESVTGSLFTGWLEQAEGKLIPRIRGSAFITGEATLHFDPADPFRGGFTALG